MVCGSCDWSDREFFLSVLHDTSAISRIIHGAAPGADTVAGVAARTLGISVQALPVDWERYGHASGAILDQATLDEGRHDLAPGFTEELGTSRGGTTWFRGLGWRESPSGSLPTGAKGRCRRRPFAQEMRNGKGGLRGRIFITGPSGSGKSTLARYLRKQGTLAVDADAIPGLMRLVDPRGRPLRSISHEQYLQVDSWQNFWDEKALQRFLSRNPDIVVCGASDNMFDLDLARLFDRRIFLRAPWAVIHARLNDPKRDNDWGRDTRPAQRAWVRRAARTWPSLARAAGFEVVDASLPLAEMLRRIGGSPLRSRERSFRRSSGASPVRIAQVAVPNYTVAREPDYHAIGVKVDQAVEAEFPDGTYVVRALGLDDHPGLNHDDLMAFILDSGTDKYDPGRKGVGHDDFSGYDYDIHAGPLTIRDSRIELDEHDIARGGQSWFGGIVWHFYHGAPIDRGHPVRLDLLTFYDPRKLVKARKLNPRTKGVRRGLGRHLYRFKDRQDKRRALLGLVEILR